MKKLVSILLATVILVTSVGTAVFADESKASEKAGGIDSSEELIEDPGNDFIDETEGMTAVPNIPEEPEEIVEETQAPTAAPKPQATKAPTKVPTAAAKPEPTKAPAKTVTPTTIPAGQEKDDDFDPEAARTISTNTDIADSLSSASDVHWYTFTIPSDGKIEVHFEHENLYEKDSYWRISLFDSTSAYGIYSQTDRGNGDYWYINGNSPSTTIPMGLPAGTYNIRIDDGYSNWSDSVYTLRVNFTESSVWEKETNHYAKDATTLSLNKDYKGNTSQNDDVDWYKFTLSSAGKIELRFSHKNFYDDNSYWRITIYDSSATYGVYSHSDSSSNDFWYVSGDSSLITIPMGLPAGTYYIRIDDGYSHWSDSIYTLRVNYTKSTLWEKESNRSAKTASTLALNTTYSGNISQNDDVDWYKFTLPSDGKFELLFDHENFFDDNSYWRITIYDSSATYGVYSHSNSSSNDFWYVYGDSSSIAIPMGLPAGTYYIRIDDGYSHWSESIYKLSINFTESPIWEKASNRIADNANTISVNRDYKGNTSQNDDVDWYKFTLSSAGKIELRFSHKNFYDDNSYWRITIYDSSATYGVYSHSTSSSNDYWYVKGDSTYLSIPMGLPAGTYYIRIDDGYSHWSDSIYTLRVNYTKTAYWEKETNYQSGLSTGMALNKDYYGNLCANDDVDWYKFILREDGDVTILFSHAVLNSDNSYWKLYLFDSSGVTKLGEKTVNGNDDLQYRKYLEAGTYYIKLDNASYFSNNTYTLHVKSVPPMPGTVTATVLSMTSVKVSWSAVDGVEGYQVWKSESPDSGYVLNSTVTDALYKNIGSLQTRHRYYFKVRAYKTVGGNRVYGDFSSVVNAVPILKAPTNVKAKASSPTTVDISWTPSSGTQFVQVWRTDKQNAEQKDYVLLGTYKAADKASISKFLTPNKTYYYKLRGYTKLSNGSTVYSGYSKIVSARPSVSIGTPTGLRVTSTGKDSVSLVWDKVSGSNIMYEVWRMTSRTNTPGVCLGRYKDPSKLSTNLKAGTTYYYRVRAYYYYYDGNGQVHRVYGSYGSIVAGTTKK